MRNIVVAAAAGGGMRFRRPRARVFCHDASSVNHNHRILIALPGTLRLQLRSCGLSCACRRGDDAMAIHRHLGCSCSDLWRQACV